MHELEDATLERRPLEQHVASTRLAAEPDIRPKAVDEPGVAPARVATPEADDVAEVQRDDGMA